MQRIQQAAGLILERGDGSIPAFRGSCFSFRSPGIFLTAQHCVVEADVDNLMVHLPTLGNPLNGTLSVRGVEAHPSADVAILFADVPNEAMPHSMSHVDWASEWGESVISFGYPEDTAAQGVLPTPRIVCGNIQRFFDHNDGRGTYRALELSFPAPAGLSGSPVSRTQDTGAVVGLIAANHSALSYRGSFEVSDEKGTYRALERDIIRYGIAVYLPDLLEWLDDTIVAARPNT